MSRKLKSVWRGLAVLSFILVSHSATAENAPVSLKTFGTHSRLVFRVDSGVESAWKSDSSGFEILFKGITLSDMGAPFGDEKSWIARYTGLSDDRLADLSFNEIDEGVKVKGKWKFPKGDLAPAFPEMQVFDFREKGKPQYVIDFWPKKGPTVAEIRRQREKDRQIAAVKKAKARSEARVYRRIARVEREKEAAQLDLFCQSSLNEKDDVFIPFRPSRNEIDFGKWFSLNTADAEYPYYEPQDDSEEAQYVRLILRLYRQGKTALSIRSVDFFHKKFPHSKFYGEMGFLKANALIKLGHRDDSEKQFRAIMERDHHSPVALYSGMYIAAQSLKKGNKLRALEDFLWLTTHHADHRLNWVFHLGAAEALYELQQTDKGVKEYAWIVENGPDAIAKAGAAFRSGDLYLDRRQYAQALAEYYQAIKRFPDHARKDPFIQLNRGEALYWLGQYEKAERVFRTFLKSHDSHPDAWRATFRLGEIHARQKGDVARQQASVWFKQTIDRSPLSPGVVLARLRLLPCGDHGGFQHASAMRFFETEAAAYDGSGEVFMEHYRDLLNLARVRTLITLGQRKQAVEDADRILRESPKAKSSPIIAALAKKALRLEILSQIDEGKGYEAMAFFERHHWMIDQEGGAILPDFLMKLSQAAATLRLGSYSKMLIDRYQNRKKKDLEARGLASHEELDPRQAESIDQALQLSEEYFSKAFAAWMVNGSGAEEEIRHNLDRVVPESPLSFRKEILLARIQVDRSLYKNALLHIEKAKLLNRTPGKTLDRIDYWASRLYLSAEEPALYERSIQDVWKRAKGWGDANLKVDDEKLNKFLDVAGVPLLPSAENLALEIAQHCELRKDWSSAISVYREAQNRGIQSDRILYGLSSALLQRGERADRGRAIAALKKISENGESDFWKKLATDSINQLAKEGESP